MTLDIRHNGIVGVYEDEDEFPPVSIHFSEWWNGEGIDFTMSDDTMIHIHSTDLSALVAIAIATGYVDIESCIQKAKEMTTESSERADDISRIREFVGTDRAIRDTTALGQFNCGDKLYWADPTGEFPVEIYDVDIHRFRTMTEEEFKILDACRYPRDYNK